MACQRLILKTWPTFVEDIEKVQDEILVYHYTPDNMPKQGRRRILLDVDINGLKRRRKFFVRVMQQGDHYIKILIMEQL